MKKVLVVLLIAVLAVGSVFAAVSGSVTAGYKFDFTNETAAYNLGGAYSKLSFTLITDSGSSTGSNKPYATATVDLDVFDVTVAKNNGFAWTWTTSGVTFTPGSASLANAITFTLSEFKIVGENWSADLLGAKLFGNYAKSAWEIDATDDENALSFNNIGNLSKKSGVTVTYDDYKVGIYATASNSSSEFGVSSETKAIEFEGGSAQAAVDFGYVKASGSDATLKFAGSVKADYEISDVAIAAAADAYVAKDVFDADVSATASYKPVVFDFFYATTLSKAADAYSDMEKILSVRAQFDVAELAEDVKVKVTAKAENLINDAKILSAEAEVTAIENLDLTVGFNDMLKKGTAKQYLFAEAVYTGIENITLSANAGYSFGNKAFDAGIKAEYAAEKFTVVGAGQILAVDGLETKLAGRLGISSTAIVDNATIGADLVFNEKQLLKNYGTTNYLNAYVKVAF